MKLLIRKRMSNIRKQMKNSEMGRVIIIYKWQIYKKAQNT